MASRQITLQSLNQTTFSFIVLAISGVITMLWHPLAGFAMVTGSGAYALAWPRAQRLFIKARSKDKAAQVYRMMLFTPFGIYKDVRWHKPIGIRRLFSGKPIYLAYAKAEDFEEPVDGYRQLKTSVVLTPVKEPIREGLDVNSPYDLADMTSTGDIQITFGKAPGIMDKLQLGLMALLAGGLFFLCFVIYSDMQKQEPAVNAPAANIQYQTLPNGQVVPVTTENKAP